MVAFLRPETSSRPSRPLPHCEVDGSRHLRLVVDNTGAKPLDDPAPSTPSGFIAPLAVLDRLVDRLSTVPLVGQVIGVGPVVALAAALLFGALLAVRGTQGQPPADDWPGVVSAASSSSPVGVGGAQLGADDVVVVVAPGDSLWSIADRYAPGHDRRDAVDMLADLNGGTVLQVGQPIVVPGELLD